MLSLFALLMRRSSATVLVIALVGSVAGLCNSGLLALISQTLGPAPSLSAMLIVGYLLLCLGMLVSNLLPEILLSRLSRSLAAELRLTIGQRILESPLRRLERIGQGPVLAALTQDLPTLVTSAAAIPSFVVSLTIVLGCLGYMAWLSPKGLLLVLPAMGILIGVYALAARRIYPRWRAERDAQDGMYREQQQVLDGIKELKLHGRRRGEFFERDFRPAVEDVRVAGGRAAEGVAVLNNFMHFFTWVVIGLMLFGVFSLTRQNNTATRGYVLALMYMWGPFRGLVEGVGQWPQAGIALDKLARLDVSLSEHAQDTPSPLASPESSSTEGHELRCSAITYTFDADSGAPHAPRAFQVGPIDLELRPGELVFVVGGNGSGKTTLAKLLTGLYLPDSGQVTWNGVPVTDQNREAYRNTFSAIFSDFHLFETLRGIPANLLEDQAQDYLRLLSLDHKVRVVDGRFSTTSLSTGQRKRLAMFVALLEDRPFYLFDEWAADQDPEYREVFYRKLLPDLVARGKGVVVITHDDRFFHLAHRLLKLEYGKLVARAQPA